MRAVFCCLLALSTGPAWAQTACDRLWDRAMAAQEDAAALATLSVEARAGGCAKHRVLGQRAALAAMYAAEARLAPLPPLEAMAAIEAIAVRAGHRPWKLSFAMGQLAYRARRHDLALRHFIAARTAAEEAHTLDKGAAPSPAQAALLERLYTETNIVSALHGQRPGGTDRACAERASRGVVTVSEARPVLFDVDKATLKPAGREEVDQLFDCLKRYAITTITITGHTDETGTRAHNQRLSERRAKNVAAYLHDLGFPGEIVTLGYGEDRPFVPYDPGAFTLTERHALDRRVEFSLTRE